MTLGIKCTLCNSKVDLFYESNLKKYFKKYYKCTNCSSILLDPLNLLSREEERKRYETHNNDVEDPGYQTFVSPIVNEIERRFNAGHTGLDFGAGTGPVITKLLREKGFKIELYDPFFWDRPEILESKYDYIACCEVAEHFHYPGKEFKLLRSLLKPGGALYCMTEVYSEDTDFERWYYKNDPTHVFFYHKHALEWIRSHFHFSELEIKGRLIQFLV